MATKRARRRRLDHRLVLFALQVAGLGFLWIVFSGKPDALHLAFGVLSIAIVLGLTRGITFSRERPGESRALASLRLVDVARYLLWLVKEVILANLDVAKIILKRDMPIDPVLVRFESALESDVAKVTLGNSITLTPGTLTVELDDDGFLVHALTESAATSPVIGEMERRLASVWGEPRPPELVLHVARSLDEAAPRRNR